MNQFYIKGTKVLCGARSPLCCRRLCPPVVVGGLCAEHDPPLSKISVESHQNMPYFGGFVLIILDITSINLSNMVDGLEFVVL